MAPQTTPAASADPMLVIKEKNGAKFLQVDVPLAGFRFDDVTVRPDGCRLLVLAKSGDVVRTVCLPESVDPYTIEAEMTDGILSIEAPMMC